MTTIYINFGKYSLPTPNSLRGKKENTYHGGKPPKSAEKANSGMDCNIQ